MSDAEDLESQNIPVGPKTRKLDKCWDEEPGWNIFRKIPGKDSKKINFYLFKVNNGNTRARCEICSMFHTFTHLTPCSSVSIVKFEHVITGWVWTCAKGVYDSYPHLQLLGTFARHC